MAEEKQALTQADIDALLTGVADSGPKPEAKSSSFSAPSADPGSPSPGDPTAASGSSEGDVATAPGLLDKLQLETPMVESGSTLGADQQAEEEYFAEISGAPISFGNAEIDSKMGGGIPKGSLTLIEGESGSGKSVLTQQMIWASLKNELKVLLYTTEGTIKSLLGQLDSLNLSILDRFLLGQVLIFPAHTTQGSQASSEVFDILLNDIRKYKDADLIVIDSITSMMLHTEITRAITFFEDCKQLCDQGKTIINVIHTYTFDDSALLRIRSMCDTHLKLRVEEIGDQLIKVLEVGKIRGAQKSVDNIISFNIEAGIGMTIIPISRTRA